MKPKALQLLSSTLLIMALLFTQVGATFYHSNHDVHLDKSITKPLEKGKAGIQKHDEHCKLCSIDFFHQALLPASLLLRVANVAVPLKSLLKPEFRQTFSSFSKGRAPPSIALSNLF